MFNACASLPEGKSSSVSYLDKTGWHGRELRIVSWWKKRSKGHGKLWGLSSQPAWILQLISRAGCMCVCVYIMHIHTYTIYICICIRRYIHIYIYTHIYIFIYTYIYIFIYIYIITYTHTIHMNRFSFASTYPICLCLYTYRLQAYNLTTGSYPAPGGPPHQPHARVVVRTAGLT